jgi:transposase-like protein
VSRNARRDYSAEEKAAALVTLRENAGNLSATAKQIGIPYHTLRCWSIGVGVSSAVIEHQHAKKADRAARWDAVQDAYVDRLLNENVVGSTPANQAATVAAIAVDKAQLLRGLPTEIVQVTVRIYEMAEKRGIRASDLFEAMVQQLEATADA